MPTVAEVRSHVLMVLAKQMAVEVNDDGEIMLMHESVMCVVSVVAWDPKNAASDIVIQVRVPVLWEAPRTPVLYEWVATAGQKHMIGRVTCDPDPNPALTNLFMEYAIIVEDLADSMILNAVGALVTAVNDVDEEWQKHFGGKRSIDLA